MNYYLSGEHNSKMSQNGKFHHFIDLNHSANFVIPTSIFVFGLYTTAASNSLVSAHVLFTSLG